MHAKLSSALKNLYFPLLKRISINIFFHSINSHSLNTYGPSTVLLDQGQKTSQQQLKKLNSKQEGRYKEQQFPPEVVTDGIGVCTGYYGSLLETHLILPGEKKDQGRFGTENKA